MPGTRKDSSCDGSWASVQRGLGVLRCSCGKGDTVDLEANTEGVLVSKLGSGWRW